MSRAVVLSGETATKLKEVFRSSGDGDATTIGAGTAVAVGNNRVCLVYATGVVPDPADPADPLVHNSFQWWEGRTIVLDGGQNGTASTELVYLIQQTNDIESGRYYVAVETGAVPDPAPSGLTAGRAILMVPVPAEDKSPPPVYLSENLWNPTGWPCPSFQGTAPMLLFDSGQGFVIYNAANPHPTYPANLGGYDLLKPFVSIRNADGTNWPGIVSMGTQTFAGDKTFIDTVNVAQSNLVGTPPTRYLSIGGSTAHYVSVAGGGLALAVNSTVDYAFGYGLTASIGTSMAYFLTPNPVGYYAVNCGAAGSWNLTATQAANSAYYLWMTTGYLGARGGTADPATATASDQKPCFTIHNSDGAYGTDSIGNQFQGGICTGVGATALPPSPPAGTFTGTLP